MHDQFCDPVDLGNDVEETWQLISIVSYHIPQYRRTQKVLRGHGHAACVHLMGLTGADFLASCQSRIAALRHVPCVAHATCIMPPSNLKDIYASGAPCAPFSWLNVRRRRIDYDPFNDPNSRPVIETIGRLDASHEGCTQYELVNVNIKVNMNNIPSAILI